MTKNVKEIVSDDLKYLLGFLDTLIQIDLASNERAHYI